MKKRLVLASLLILSVTSCIPLAVIGGAGVGAAAAIATPVIVKKIKDEKDEKHIKRKINEKGEYLDEVNAVIK